MCNSPPRFTTRGTSRFGLILFLLLALAFRASRSFIIANVWKFRRAIIIGAAVFLVGFIPIVLIYLPAIRVGTWYRFDFVMEMIPDWRVVVVDGRRQLRLGMVLQTDRR